MRHPVDYEHRAGLLQCDNERLNIKIGKKVAGGTLLGTHGINSQNKKGQLLSDFAENHLLKIVKPFLLYDSAPKADMEIPVGSSK